MEYHNNYLEQGGQIFWKVKKVSDLLIFFWIFNFLNF
jgi:hypothetical protein